MHRLLASEGQYRRHTALLNSDSDIQEGIVVAEMSFVEKIAATDMLVDQHDMAHHHNLQPVAYKHKVYPYRQSYSHVPAVVGLAVAQTSSNSVHLDKGTQTIVASHSEQVWGWCPRSVL